MASRKEIIKRTIPKDFSDEQTQAEILSPPGAKITIGGEPVMIYPLSGFDVRTLTGYTSTVLAEVGPVANTADLTMRVIGVLTKPRYVTDCLSLLAKATFATPKDFDEAQHAAIFKEFNDKTASATGALELADAFVTMAEQNGVLSAFFNRTTTTKKGK